MDHCAGDEDIRAGGGARAGGAYLVVLRHVVVAQDIAQTLEEAVPGAAVIVAPSMDDAAMVPDGVERVAVAFVGAGPRAWRTSALARAVAARGGRVVLMGGKAEAEGVAAGFDVLFRPFSIAAVLGQLGDR